MHCSSSITVSPTKHEQLLQTLIKRMANGVSRVCCVCVSMCVPSLCYRAIRHKAGVCTCSIFVLKG